MCEVYVVDEKALLQRTAPPSAHKIEVACTDTKHVEIYV